MVSGSVCTNIYVVYRTDVLPVNTELKGSSPGTFLLYTGNEHNNLLNCVRSVLIDARHNKFEYNKPLWTPARRGKAPIHTVVVNGRRKMFDIFTRKHVRSAVQDRKVQPSLTYPQWSRGKRILAAHIRPSMLVAICMLVIVGCSSVSPGTSTESKSSMPTATTPPTPTTPATLPDADWTTYHGNNTRTGYVANMPDPHKLTRAWKVRLDGAVYASPLVVGGHVIVVTEGDSLYSLDMHTGQTRWHTHVGTPVPRSTL